MRIRRHSSSPTVSVRELQYKITTPESTPDNILEEIVWHKEKEIALQREKLPLLDLQKRVRGIPSPLNFLNRLRQGQTSPALIAEVKKASPSKGVFRESFNPEEIALAYEKAGASCLSVLTDEKFFQGGFSILKSVRKSVKLPLLCKDFIIYPYQIYNARLHGADAVLLIAAILSNQDLMYFLKIVKALGMTALVEVHTLEELDRVIEVAGVELIGINNRNLESFTVDLSVTHDLISQRQTWIQEQAIVIVSESGIHSRDDIQAVKNAGAQAVLIGESLIKDLPSTPPFDSEDARMQYKISNLFG